MNASIVLKLLDGVTGPMRKVQQAFADASKSMETFGERAEKAFKRAEAIKIAGEGVHEFAEKSREAVEKMVKPFEQLEQQLNRIKAVSGASGEQMEEIEGVARKVGASGRAGATEAAAALEQMATSGFKVNAALETLPTMLNRAKVANVSLAEATVGATDTAKKFGLALDSEVITHLNDLTAKMAFASGTSFQNMNSALTESGTAARAAGVSVERTTELIGLLAQKGIQGGEAGGALNLMFRNLNRANIQKTITEASGGMVKLRDSTGKLRDPLAILTDLTKDMTKKGIDLGHQTTFLSQLFPRNAKTIQMLMQASEEPGMKTLNDALKDVAGTLDRMSNEELKNGVDKTKRLQGAIENLQSTIGARMAPTLDHYKEKMTAIVDKTTEWLNKNPELERAVGFTALAISGGASALDKLTGVATVFLALKGVGLSTAGWAKFGLTLGGIAAPILAAASALAYLGYEIDQISEKWNDVKGLQEGVERIGKVVASVTSGGVGGMSALTSWATNKLTNAATSYMGGGGTMPNGSVDINVTGPAKASIGPGSEGLNMSVDPRAGVPMMSGG